MSRVATVELIKNGKTVGWVKITPKGSTGILWAHAQARGLQWIDSSDIEIDFDESSVMSDSEE